VGINGVWCVWVSVCVRACVCAREREISKFELALETTNRLAFPRLACS